MTHYTRDEVEEILRRALETQPLETLSHADLVAAAVEAGIDGDDVEAAAHQLEQERELNAEEERILARRKRSFLQSIYTYVIVNSGLFLIDAMSGRAPTEAERALLSDLDAVLRDTSICGLGQVALNPLTSALVRIDAVRRDRGGTR